MLPRGGDPPHAQVPPPRPQPGGRTVGGRGTRWGGASGGGVIWAGRWEGQGGAWRRKGGAWWGGALHLEGAGRRHAQRKSVGLARQHRAESGLGSDVGCRHAGGRRAGGQEVSRSLVL